MLLPCILDRSLYSVPVEVEVLWAEEEVAPLLALLGPVVVAGSLSNLEVDVMVVLDLLAVALVAA